MPDADQREQEVGDDVEVAGAGGEAEAEGDTPERHEEQVPDRAECERRPGWRGRPAARRAWSLASGATMPTNAAVGEGAGREPGPRVRLDGAGQPLAT